jgi:LysM repeat protein
VSYVVHPGDSLFQISLDHYGTIDRIADICALNGLSEEEIIYPGQIILLP